MAESENKGKRRPFGSSQRGNDPRYNGQNLMQTGNPMRGAPHEGGSAPLHGQPLTLTEKIELSRMTKETEPPRPPEPRVANPEATGKGGILDAIA